MITTRERSDLFFLLIEEGSSDRIHLLANAWRWASDAGLVSEDVLPAGSSKKDPTWLARFRSTARAELESKGLIAAYEDEQRRRSFTLTCPPWCTESTHGGGELPVRPDEQYQLQPHSRTLADEGAVEVTLWRKWETGEGTTVAGSDEPEESLEVHFAERDVELGATDVAGLLALARETEATFHRAMHQAAAELERLGLT